MSKDTMKKRLLGVAKAVLASEWYDPEEEHTKLGDGSAGAFCSNHARMAKQIIGDREGLDARVVGFTSEGNPDCELAPLYDGHEFLLVRDEETGTWIVDSWMDWHKEHYSHVVSMDDSPEYVKRVYGDPSTWEEWTGYAWMGLYSDEESTVRMYPDKEVTDE